MRMNDNHFRAEFRPGSYPDNDFPEVLPSWGVDGIFCFNVLFPYIFDTPS